MGDICRGLGEKVHPFCNDLMQTLVDLLSVSNNRGSEEEEEKRAFLVCLQNSAVHRSLKSPILSTLGDVAMAIGPLFKPYLEAVLTILKQASQLQVDKVQFLVLVMTVSCDAWMSNRMTTTWWTTSMSCGRAALKHTLASSRD